MSAFDSTRRRRLVSTGVSSAVALRGALCVWGVLIVGASPVRSAEPAPATTNAIAASDAAAVAQTTAGPADLVSAAGADAGSSGATQTTQLQLASAGAGALVATAAGDELQEVLVTAQKREQVELVKGLQNVPTSISIVSGDELAKLDAYDITDILQRTANAHWNFGTPRTGTISLRGVSGLAGTNQQPSVGTTVDGVSFADTALFSIQDFTDIDNLQVIRGPTGTEGGKNSQLGVLQITTKGPTFEPQADVSLTLGSQGTVKGQAAAGGPIIDNLLAWRGTFYTDKQTGAYPNVYNPDASYLNTDRTAGKLQLLLTPGNDFTALVGYLYQPSSHEYVNGLAFNELTPPTYANGAPVNSANSAVTKLGRSWFTQEANYTVSNYLQDVVNNDAGGPVVFNTEDEWAVLTWNIGGGALKSITGHDQYRQQAENDDGTPFDITKQGGNILHYDQTSEELRYNSATGGLIDYTTGLYFLASNLNALSRTLYGSDAGAYYANAAEYNQLDANGAGQALLLESLDRLQVINNALYSYQTEAYFGHINWHPWAPFTLGAGIRVIREYRSDVQSNGVADQGYGGNLNPVSNDNVSLGGFATTNTGALTAADSSTQLSLADRVANQIFGAVITSTPGAAYNSLTAGQKLQVADAQLLRAAQLTGLYTPVRAVPYNHVLVTGEVAPSLKITDSETAYFTWQHGEKPGISQIVTATINGGSSQLVPAETSNSYEVGVKSLRFDQMLAVNADIFYDVLSNYQQSVYFYDAYLTQLLNDGTLHFLSGTGDAPKVVTKGVELDAAFSGIPHTTFRFSGAYADARYRAQTLIGQPVEDGNLPTPYYDANGKTLPNSPKFSANLGGDFRIPVFSFKNIQVFHATFNYAYTTSYNADPSLSAYYVVPAYGLADVSAGLGRGDGRFEISLLSKNVFNTLYRYPGWSSWIPSAPRWYGIQVRAALF